MQTSMALGFPHPAAFLPRPASAPTIRVANRSSMRPIIRPPAPTYHPLVPRFTPPPAPPPSRYNPFAFDRMRAEAAARAATRAELIAQQYAMQAQQQAMLPPQQVQSVPAAPGGDLTPAQDNSAAADAASAAADPQADGSHPHNKHMLLFAGLAVAAGVGGYVLIKKHKKG